MHAHPVPLDPYNPLPPSNTHTAEEDNIRHPSPFIPIRIPVFALVIWLNDSIVKVLSVGGGTPQTSATYSGGKQQRRSRALSDAASESVEAGESYELQEGSGSSKGMGMNVPPTHVQPNLRPGTTTRVTRERVTLSRRKLD
jgi:etoposide-induced 2.4 mRNA